MAMCIGSDSGGHGESIEYRVDGEADGDSCPAEAAGGSFREGVCMAAGFEG
ncbi:MAG: hypothetical protein RI897_3076 [Verrucomicrobiota bacterium]